MGKKPETKFKETRVIPDLKKLPNCWFVKIQQLSIRGVPDYLLCVNSTFVALELKKDEKETPDRLQQYNLEGINRAGGIGIVAHPGNWDITYDLLKQLAEFGYEHVMTKIEENKLCLLK